MSARLEVVVRRGPIAESVHHLQAVAVDATGRRVFATAEPERVTSFRSAAKPFQLLPLIERGHADRFGFTPEEVAVMSASHTGSAHHVDLVTGILARLGLEPRHLACGYHEPSDPASLEDVRLHPEKRSPLYNNCSGKHAGMLALALAEGWPVEGYEREAHPVQQLMRRTVAECCGLAPEALQVGVDGCSVSVFGLPLAAMAHGYARLAAAIAHGGDARAQALQRIGRALTAHPRAVEGAGRLSTALMETTGGRVAAKGGAEGLELVAVPGRSLGIAVKCEDGGARAVAPATVALLGELGVLTATEMDALAGQRRPRLTNAAGLDVGQLEAEVHATARA